MRIFFGGPLTDLKDPDKTKSFYSRLGEVAKANSFDYFWAFQQGTDPDENPNVPPQQVYNVDEYQLGQSDLMIAYVGETSTGTGIEIEYAKVHNIPVYILYEADKRISRMLRGSPIIKGEIIYKSEEEALQKVDRLLKTITAAHSAVVTQSPDTQPVVSPV